MNDFQIVFQPFPKQEEFIKAALTFEERQDSDGGTLLTNKYAAILYGGGAGGGKSRASIATLILLSTIFPGSRWAVVRENLELIRKNVFPVFEDLFPMDLLAQRPTSYNGWAAKFHNGSEIIFWQEGFDRDKELNRWKGLEVNGFVLEEANELHEKSFDKALERMGRWAMTKRWDLGDGLRSVYPQIILLTCNPASNWVKEKFYQPWKENRLQPEFLYIPATVFDNPYYSQATIELKRKTMTPFLFQKFMQGDWEITENDRPFVTEFKYDTHVYDFLEYIDAPLIISMDFNVEPPAAIVAQYGHGFLNVLDEIDIGAGSIYDVAKWIRTNYHPQFRIRLTGDASGLAREKADPELRNLYVLACQEIGITMKYDVDTPKSNPNISQNRALINSLFYNYPKPGERGFRIRIHRRCRKLIADLQGASVDKFGDLIKNRGNSVYFMDYLDAFRYLCNTYFSDFMEHPERFLR